MGRGMLAAVMWLALSPCRGAEPADSIDSAFARLYRFHFAGAHGVLDRHLAAHPNDPLGPAVRSAVYLFQELDRLGVLEAEFFAEDRRLLNRKRPAPDPDIRLALLRAVEQARMRATATLAREPADRDALFAMCLVTGVMADYTALVERRHFSSLSHGRESQGYALRLLRADPGFHDAYLTTGINEYLIGSLPFFLRWFVRFDQVEGDKRQAVQNLELVARSGRYFGPFARILLAIIHLREKDAPEAKKQLAEFARDYPENPLVRRELARLSSRMRGPN